MTKAISTRPMRSRTEQSAMTDLIERLAGQFPELSRDEIESAVHGRYAQFEESRIRDFVPVLVERAVREDMRNEVPRRNRA